jgi:hypothetical protein
MFVFIQRWSTISTSKAFPSKSVTVGLRPRERLILSVCRTTLNTRSYESSAPAYPRNT